MTVGWWTSTKELTMVEISLPSLKTNEICEMKYEIVV